MLTKTLLATMVVGGGLLAATSPANAAAYTFAQFDVPGATQTTPFGINDAGQIVGFFIDSSGVHGFLDIGGSFTTIDVPGAFTTETRGINNAGQIVGFFLINPRDQLSSDQHGFLYSGGSFTQLDVPGAFGTASADINNAGQITGGFSTVTRGHGFLDTGGSFSTFDVPGASSTDASGINDAGQIVGRFNIPPDGVIFTTEQLHGYLRDTSGSFTILDVPGAVFGTAASGIDNAGQIVGIFNGDPMLNQRGFLYSGGSFTLLDVPGATQTAPTGINDTGQIVGAFIDSTGEHGFLATPVSAVPEPSTIALLGVGAIGLGLFRRRSTTHFPTTAAPRRTLDVR